MGGILLYEDAADPRVPGATQPRPPSPLMQIILENTKHRALAKATLAELAPLRRNVATASYDLAPASDELAAQAKGAIEASLGCRVEKIIFVSRSGSPDLIPEEVHQGIYQRVFDHAIMNSRSSIIPQVIIALETEITGDLYDIVVPSLSQAMKLPARYGLQHAFLVVPILFLLALLEGSPMMIRPLLQFIRLLPRAIPLGEKIGEDGTWYVLVA